MLHPKLRAFSNPDVFLTTGKKHVPVFKIKSVCAHIHTQKIEWEKNFFLNKTNKNTFPPKINFH